jgi:cobalamin biosynthesis protein CbiD
MKSSNAKECAHNKAAADAAANAVQIARARRNVPDRSAEIPTIGPARSRVNIPVASTMPISSGLKALVSKNLGQNGDATPKAAYKAA